MDLAARLHEQEIESIQALLEKGLRDKALQSLDERGGAQELVRQQYSGRYPFELLQNADDAALGTGIQGRVRFVLTDTALIVADNGSGFGERQVQAICSLGRSSKGPGASIGHKGLGFKSVGEITDRPQIISRQTSFQFDGERVHKEALALFETLPSDQRFPVYAFPFPISDGDLGLDAAEVQQLRSKGFSTIIRLPLREKVARETVAQHLAGNLLPRLLLFLPGVEHIELRGTEADFAAEVARDAEGSVERALLETSAGDEEWLIYRGSAIPELTILEPMGDAWTKIDKVHYAIAVPLGSSGQPRVDKTFPLHVYFPTEEHPGLHVAVHAEWVLGMDRRQLAVAPEARPYNQMLMEQVTNFVATDVAVDLVTRCGASAEAVQALVPALQAHTFGTAEELRQLWSESLATSRFLPFADNVLRAPADVRMLPATLPSTAEAHALAALDEEHALRADVEALPSVREFLSSASGNREMTTTEFVGCLKPPTPTTVGRYYSFLVRWRDLTGKRLTDALKARACVLTMNGQLLTPGEQAVFFPRLRGNSPISVDIPVPIAAMPDIEGIEGFLRDLGVKPFEWRDLIRDFLIKILENPHTDPDQRARALEGLRTYHKDRRSGNEDLAPVLGRVLLPARTADGTERRLMAAAQLYFGADWTGSDDLEVIYGPFGKAEFLDAEVPGDSDDKRMDRGFYRMLGVEDHPRLDEAKAERSSDYPVGSVRHPHRGPLLYEWMAQPDVVQQASCPHGHAQTQQLELSVRLDRHIELIETRDPLRLIALWNQLARGWGKIYAPAIEAVFRCNHGWHVGDRDRKCESLFAYTLRSRPWVPVDRGQTAELVRPEDAWIDAQETPKHIRERIPRISEAMHRTPGAAGLISALHLTDAARPKVRDLLALLDNIADEASKAGNVNRETERAARWVQRTLDDVLSNEQEPHPDPKRVLLLARYNGTLRFVPQPPFADDPVLRETWEKQSPVLFAEAGLNRLTRFLSLTKLDDVVQTSAIPFAEHLGDAFLTTQKKIDHVKPYLLALVRAENARDESRARSGLQRLEIVLCEDLVLRYDYDGINVERDDAVCYIASRHEGTRRRGSTIGTAYLELDSATGEPHWFPLGRQLAQYLGVPAQADAFTMLLTVRPEDRDRMMADRQIQSHHIAEAREQLRLKVEDDEQISNVLDSLVPSGYGTEQPVPSHGADESGTDTESEPEPENVDEDGDDSKPASLTPASPVTPQPTAPPPVDYSKVQIVDAVPASLAPTTTKNPPKPTGGYGGYSTAPSNHQTEENRRVGKRGEEIVYNKERERLQTLGKNPDSVIWVSKTNELSPFDIRSLEEDQVIYIEVKSTKGADPNEAFYITQAELDEARNKRSRYYIYRVIDTDTATPTITRAADPLRLVIEGKGRLLLANARMTLAFDPEVGPSQGG